MKRFVPESFRGKAYHAQLLDLKAVDGKPHFSVVDHGAESA